MQDYNTMDMTAKLILINGFNYSCRRINCLYYVLITGFLISLWQLLSLCTENFFWMFYLSNH